jgi:hypothetical protein
MIIKKSIGIAAFAALLPTGCKQESVTNPSSGLNKIRVGYIGLTREVKIAGMLTPTTDASQLSSRAFVRLEGVSDEWLHSLKVEKVAGGQAPLNFDIRKYANVAFQDCMVDEK